MPKRVIFNILLCTNSSLNLNMYYHDFNRNVLLTSVIVLSLIFVIQTI